MLRSIADMLGVTEAQVNRCHRQEGPDGEVYYLVESESDPDVIYEVSFDEAGFHCTCPSGRARFQNCAGGTCKHCRWCVASADRDRREARAEPLGFQPQLVTL